MFDIRQIQHFEAVFRLRSFSQAADEVHLTHAALTKSIQSLEQKWGVQLFYRTTRRVSPTAAGQRLYDQVPGFLAQAEALRRTAISEHQHIRLMCGPVVLDTLVHPALLRLRDQHGHTRITAETKPPLQAAEDIIQRRAELMLIHANTLQALPYGGQLDITSIVDEPYVVVCHRGHQVLKSGRDLSDIIPHDWAIAGFDLFFQQTLPSSLSEALRDSNFPKYRLLSQTACLDMVRQSDVLTLIPERSAIALRSSDDFASFAFPGPLRFSICAARRKDMLPSAFMDDFLLALREPNAALAHGTLANRKA